MASLIVPFIRTRPIDVCFSQAKVKVLARELLGDRLEDDDYYIENNGRIINDEDTFVYGNNYYVRLRVLGGKGGFGSMLRSIGAQIEKTTNHEACRDLSGRRMRDINNEKRLQEWAAKAAEREKAKAERRRERRERMKAGAARHRFDDPQYEQQKASIAENLDAAIEEGLMRAGPSYSTSAAASTSTASETQAKKRKCPATETSVKKKAARPWLAVDVDVEVSSSSSSSDESSDDVAMLDVTAASSAVNRTDDSGACCSHDALITAAAAAVASESSRSSSEDSTSAAGSSTSHTSVIDDTSAQTTETQSEIAQATLNGCSADIEEQVKVVSVSGEDVNLDDYDAAEDLEQLGLEVLKTALMCRGLKCGGTLQQRAERLFSVKGLEQDDIPSSLLAKPPRK